MLAASVRRYGGEWTCRRYRVTAAGSAGALEGVRAARGKVVGLPEALTLHDLRQYLASLLIASGADIKTVQAQVRG